MSRILATFAAAAILSGCALSVSPASSHAAILVGIGDEYAATFTNPLYTALKVKRARVFVAWNAALVKSQRSYLDGWLGQASASGTEPLVSFSQSVGSKCPKKPCKLPTTREYTKAFRAFRKRYPTVKTISVWNEANHRSQPTFKQPKRAAQYYNIVRKYCHGCRIIAADVIDDRNMEPWLRVFKRYAHSPRLWGLHNYLDTNYPKGPKTGGTRRLLKAVRGEVWLTETGGIVKFVLPNGRTQFKTSTSRANKAVVRMFALAKRYRSRIKRLYIYNFRQQDSKNRFDAALVDKKNRARPGYRTVKRNLATSSFNP